MSEPNGFAEALAKVGGVLLCGGHGPGTKACLLEAESVRLGIEWTDDPRKVRMFDLRPLNDAFGWGARARTEALTPVWRAYAGSLDWPQDRQRRVVERVVVDTVRELIADLPGLPEDVRAQCRAARTVPEAAAAAHAAYAAARDDAADAAHAASYAASLPAVDADADARAAARAAEAAAYAASVAAAEAAADAAAPAALAADAAAAVAARAAIAAGLDARIAVARKAAAIWLRAAQEAE